ncbi:MAG: DUF4956 domain-containing protein [Erysipelotrichaceae bacterium]|nr:DUF4956 domain-containing protein [Erysipelotrichaceae bacterium]
MNLFGSIFSTSTTVTEFLIALVASMAMGLIISFFYMYKNQHSKSFATALVIMPAAVTMVIMLVNGNIGAGLGVAGSFSLMKFRSAQANAKDLICVFLCVAVGLCCGMGYIVIAAVFLFLVLLVSFVLAAVNFGEDKNERILRVTVPEDLNYSEEFADVFEKYTSRNEMISIKTSNLGSLYKCEYAVTLKDPADPKSFLDELRTRNGNLEVALGKYAKAKEAL